MGFTGRTRYKREERDKALLIAEALAGLGYKVWWDIELLPGSSFGTEISTIIEKSKVVIVLWSKASVESDFVLGEAELARKKGTIVPARLDDCEIPLQFSNYHTLDLIAWTASPDRSHLEPLLKAVAERIAPSAEVPESVDATATALKNPEFEAQIWRAIASAERQSVQEYQTYLERFGDDGVFSDLARIRVNQLVKEEKTSKRFSLSKGAKVATAVAALITVVFGAILKGSEVLGIVEPIIFPWHTGSEGMQDVVVRAVGSIKYRCNTNVSGVEVRIVGKLGDWIEIHDLTNGVFYQEYKKTIEDMGGTSGNLMCNDVYSNDSIIVVRTGENNDKVQIYGTLREPDGKLKLTQYLWRPDDSPIDVKFSSNRGMPSVQFLNGRNRDRFYRVCWGLSGGFQHSAYKSQFTNGWKNCNQILPKSDDHREVPLSE